MAHDALPDLIAQIDACRHCAGLLPHEPRPVVQASASARLLIIGQAPGSRVHASGVPWDDESGKRLCEWTGLSNDLLHDSSRVAIMPMGFCYPGKGDGGDLPPRRECAPLWHSRLSQALADIRLTLLVGSYAHKAYLPPHLRRSMTEAVRRHDEAPEGFIPLPHPSWRSRIWMSRNPWFEEENLPALRRAVSATLNL